MVASKTDISKWFDHGVMLGESYMLIIRDTSDQSDSPIYAGDSEGARQSIAYYRNGPPYALFRILEAYDLHAPKQPQLDADLTWRLPLQVTITKGSAR